MVREHTDARQSGRSVADVSAIYQRAADVLGRVAGVGGGVDRDSSRRPGCSWEPACDAGDALSSW
jgi:hypothetical protein